MVSNLSFITLVRDTVSGLSCRWPECRDLAPMALKIFPLGSFRQVDRGMSSLRALSHGHKVAVSSVIWPDDRGLRGEGWERQRRQRVSGKVGFEPFFTSATSVEETSI